MTLKFETERQDNGVRRRIDGAGDDWAQAHRDHAGRDCYMQDVDGLFGFSVYAHNTADRLWMEYIPDNYRNRFNPVREFALVGVFDRKRSWDAAFNEKNTLSKGVYCWLCRSMAKVQPVAPRFFYVIGANAPWQMVEVDIKTATKMDTPAVVLDENGWDTVFRNLGFAEMRTALRKWIDR